jgi:hypothetical protein
LTWNLFPVFLVDKNFVFYLSFISKQPWLPLTLYSGSVRPGISREILLGDLFVWCE